MVGSLGWHSSGRGTPIQERRREEVVGVAELCEYAWLFEQEVRGNRQVLGGQWKDRILGGARLRNELHGINQVFDSGSSSPGGYLVARC